MKNATWLALMLLLTGCSDSPQPNHRDYIDPLTGETQAAVVTAIEGWETTQFASDPRKFVMLSQSNRPVVSILGDGLRRDIYVEGKRVGADQLEIRTSEDGSIEQVKMFSNGTLYSLTRSGEDWVLLKDGQ